jgi:hypothetical protein
MAELAAAPEPPSTPRWIAPSLEVKPGRDPLGLQTTTQDRLMPVLLPGILELSRRARYQSFHAFLLDEYARKRLPADSLSLSIFVKRREWDYGLAVLSCPNNCGSVPVGADSLRPPMRQSGPPFPWGESVQSAFGGYGLYYRSPLAELGIVARAGTPLGDQPIPIDVLTRSERASRLAASFRAAVEETKYLKHWMYNDQPLPVEVLREYAQVGCLCQLPFRDEERHAVQEALFGTDSAPVQEQVQAIEDVDIAQILPRERTSPWRLLPPGCPASTQCCPLPNAARSRAGHHRRRSGISRIVMESAAAPQRRSRPRGRSLGSPHR